MRHSLLLLSALLVCGLAHADDSFADLTRKADAGDLQAQNELATRYQKGIGVAIDTKKALAIFQKAAEAGFPEAQYNIGVMYDSGAGVDEDKWLASDWYKKAASHGYPPAMLNLGINYASGEGVEQDFVEGMKWISLARMVTVNDPDAHLRWRVNGAYDSLKATMKSSQLKRAEAESKALFDAFYASKKGS